jgi:hypothetical protein
MDLLINYGTTASAGGQPVIAEIEIGASTSQYNLNFVPNGGYYDHSTGILTDNDGWHTVTKTAIQNNSLIVNNNNWTYIHFWNNNTYLGHYQNSNVTTSHTYFNVNNYLGIWNNIIPSNATHFAFISRAGQTVWSPQYTIEQFQTLTVSYTSSSSLATTTFYDSYPGGNVIGTTNGTEVGGDQQGPTLIVSTGRRSFPAGSLDSDQNWRSSQVIDLPVGATSVNFDSASKYTVIKFDVGGDFYNPTTAPSNAGTMLSNGLTAPVPSGATKIIMMAYTLNSFGYTAVSESSFGSLVLSFVALTYLQIDPPTGKRIKQIALKGL